MILSAYKEGHDLKVICLEVLLLVTGVLINRIRIGKSLSMVLTWPDTRLSTVCYRCDNSW